MPARSATADEAWPLPDVFTFRGQSVRHGEIGDGPPLVMVHGTPFSSVVWRRIAPHFASRRRVYTFDLLGYGRSEMRDGQDVSLGVQNELLSALIDHWGIENPDVVAHDFGGATALRAHLLNGRDYRTLTLIDPVATGPTGSPFVQSARANEQVFAGLPPYIHAALLDAYIAGAAHRRMSAEALELYAGPWKGETGQAAFYRQIAQMDDRYTDEVQPRYGEIRCPVSILWGREDAWIPYERGELLARLIPHAELVPVPAAGHLVQEDAPEAIVAHVLKTLDTPLAA